MQIQVYNLGSLNLRISPFLHKSGDLIRCVNMEKDMYGALKKRPGYTTYLGTPDNAQVNSLFTWQRNDGTTFWNYRYSGSVLYYSTQGTGAWTVCGGGTLTNNARIGNAVLEDTMIIGDGTAATRHTTNGTSFTNTTSAPIAAFFDDYQNRIWAGGTSSNLFYSTTGTPTDWTSDSSSIAIPGAGRMNATFKANDRIVTGKNSGLIHRYDGYNLVDLTTNLGPSSPYSIGKAEDYRFWLNRLGIFGYGGGKPEILSNAIERQIYNDAGEGIVGTIFDTAPGVVHRYDYFAAVGTVTDDLTDETINRCILKYDFQANEWGNYEFAVLPTAWCPYKDESGNQQLIFGDATGQCYTFGGTNLNDNGSTISSVMEGMIGLGVPHLDKKWDTIWAFANPGCEAHLQVAIENTFTKVKKRWISIGDLKDGFVEYRFPSGTRGKLLFWKVTEASRNSRYHFYGFALDADVIER